jgi:hypothetical protein
MKKILCSCLFIVGSVLFFSCQDKYLMGIISPATGSLKAANGDCLPKTVGGVFIAGKAVGDTNFIQVSVNVKTTGNYVIKTNAVNGYSFSSSGSFTGTGTNQVKLVANGKPTTAASNDFTVSFDTSVCQISITVVAEGGAVTATTPAAFTLAGAPNVCMNYVVLGSYVKDVALDTSSKVSISVNVTATGTYSVSTSTVNGYKFSGAGVFTKTGIQNMILTASGTPAGSSADNFILTAGSSTCIFGVTVLTALVVVNNDHFPLTKNSYWTYDDVANPGDTLQRSIIDSVTNLGYLYKIMEEKTKYLPPSQYLFRKEGDIYYESTSVDKYTSSVKYKPEIIKDIPFLKENLATGDTWSSEDYIGTATFGQKIYFKYDFSCLAASAGATVNGKTFANVCKILMSPQIRSDPFYPYASTSEKLEFWYAKGVGLIYAKRTNSFSSTEWKIRYWVVN